MSRSSTESAGPAVPRWRDSLAGRVTALVLLVLAAAVASALVLLHQVREVQRRFDLLTEVYVAFDHELAAAHLQAMRIGFQVARYQGGDPSAAELALRPTFQTALAERARRVRAAHAPIARALAGGDLEPQGRALADLRAIDDLLSELEAMVDVGESPDPVAVLADVKRQARIERAFQTLADRSRRAIVGLRGDVQAAQERTERLILALGAIMGALAGLAVVGVAVTLRPLRKLTEQVRTLGRGEWPVKVAGADRGPDDEVRALAREFQAMADALAERERRLIQGERLAAMGRLAAQITHEIRNPLSSLALNVELLEDELPAEAGEGRRLLRKITAEVDRLAAVTDEYLAFARRPRPHLKPVDLCELVADVVEFQAGEMASAGVDRVLSGPGEPVYVRADPDQLRQALFNLLRNAQEAVLAVDVADRTPRIEVRVRRTEGWGEVEVADNGPGVTADSAQIFEAFFTTKARGTGLGLPIVQQIAEDHGGSVQLAATGPGGSVFRVRLPACDPPKAPVPSAHPTAAPGSGRAESE